MLSNNYLRNSQKKLFYGIAAGIVTSDLVVAKGVYELKKNPTQCIT